ncbi:molybdenum hydroxylase, partial [Xanthomonas citri pv. citri]|nr:molybdenum hydroxylase [Xanthomonas citri pv. citri]
MLVVIRGAGDIATGIALRLFRSGIKIVMTDLPQPTSIRRTVCFSEAIRHGSATVEGVEAVLAKDAAEAK